MRVLSKNEKKRAGNATWGEGGKARRWVAKQKVTCVGRKCVEEGWDGCGSTSSRILAIFSKINSVTLTQALICEWCSCCSYVRWTSCDKYLQVCLMRGEGWMRGDAESPCCCFVESTLIFPSMRIGLQILSISTVSGSAAWWISVSIVSTSKTLEINSNRSGIQTRLLAWNTRVKIARKVRSCTSCGSLKGNLSSKSSSTFPCASWCFIELVANF